MATVLTASSRTTIEQLLETPVVRNAFKLFGDNAAAITEEQIKICSIPAPPFQEQARAEYLREKFSTLGLNEARLDQEGNCVALRRGRSRSPLIVVSAHLDTVFPANTDLRVRYEGSKILAPGISDDGCGLAALMALIQVLEELSISTEGSLLFVGTVGEEGEGNLRGVRHLLTKGEFANRIDAFLSFDGPGADRITNGALASRRYRVSLRGTGGHSWGDFGVANPVHALGRAITKLASYPAPRKPRTTFNVARVEGGGSVNAIPQEATMDVDLRSASEVELLKLDAFFRRATMEASEDENALRKIGGPPLDVNIELIGERPGGETPIDSFIVRLACDATEAVGATPSFEQASTDSNLPISLGIPAITLGAGGASDNSHTVAEWYDPTGREVGLRRALLVVLGAVGLKN